MKEKLSKKEQEPNPYHIDYEHYLDTNACTECTGLMYRAPENRKEWDAYREIYDFIPGPPEKGKKAHSPLPKEE